MELNDIIPDERIKSHGKYYYQLLDALGLLNERYVQLFILGIGSAGAAASDIVAIVTYFKSAEEEKEGKEEKKQWKGEGNKSDLSEKDKIRSQMKIMEEMNDMKVPSSMIVNLISQIAENGLDPKAKEYLKQLKEGKFSRNLKNVE